MTERDGGSPEQRHVPGIGGPGSTDTGADGRSALRLHAGISVVAGALCAFVTVVFAVVLGSIAGAVVFGLVTLACIGWGIRARQRLRAGRRAAHGSG